MVNQAGHFACSTPLFESSAPLYHFLSPCKMTLFPCLVLFVCFCLRVQNTRTAGTKMQNKVVLFVRTKHAYRAKGVHLGTKNAHKSVFGYLVFETWNGIFWAPRCVSV